MSRTASPTRGARTAAAVAVVLALALVAVLVGLVGSSGSDGSEVAAPVPAAPSASVRPSTRATPPAGRRDPESGLRVVALSALPREAQATVALIDAGGPFPYAKDGVTFSNNERILPNHPRGWYREYTVRTPGERDRGPRRIVTGDDDRVVFYTADHYASFVRVSR